MHLNFILVKVALACHFYVHRYMSAFEKKVSPVSCFFRVLSGGARCARCLLEWGPFFLCVCFFVFVFLSVLVFPG